MQLGNNSKVDKTVILDAADSVLFVQLLGSTALLYLWLVVPVSYSSHFVS